MADSSDRHQQCSNRCGTKHPRLLPSSAADEQTKLESQCDREEQATTELKRKHDDMDNPIAEMGVNAPGADDTKSKHFKAESKPPSNRSRAQFEVALEEAFKEAFTEIEPSQLATQPKPRGNGYVDVGMQTIMSANAPECDIWYRMVEDYQERCRLEKEIWEVDEMHIRRLREKLGQIGEELRENDRKIREELELCRRQFAKTYQTRLAELSATIADVATRNSSTETLHGSVQTSGQPDASCFDSEQS